MSRPPINFSIDKKQAFKIAKKATMDKVPIISEEEFAFIAGGPMMTVKVEVGDGIITVKGRGMGASISNSIYDMISDALEEANSKLQQPESTKTSKNGSLSLSIEDQIKAIELIKKYKELLDIGVISQEEFDEKKKELLFQKTSISVSLPSESPIIFNSSASLDEIQPQKDKNIDSGDLNQISNDTSKTDSFDEFNKKIKKIFRAIELLIIISCWACFVAGMLILLFANNRIYLPFCDGCIDYIRGNFFVAASNYPFLWFLFAVTVSAFVFLIISIALAIKKNHNRFLNTLFSSLSFCFVFASMMICILTYSDYWFVTVIPMIMFAVSTGLSAIFLLITIFKKPEQ